MSALQSRDLDVLWHPCTQMKDHERLPPIPIRRGKGVWLEDFSGKRYLDAIGSWWVSLFGHGHFQINQAIRRQLDRLEHVMLAGFTHTPAVQLAEQLVDLTPPQLCRCFMTDSGSAAVEAALKMSFHYWRNKGHTGKRRFICLEHGYHGETLGALAVGGVPLYREVYAPLLMDVIVAPSPEGYARAPGCTPAEHARRRFADVEALLARHAEEVCAVIVEPLVQGAGGMRMYPPEYLRLLRAACQEHGVHLIADEIAVGFGRTGTMFACEQAGISPDMMCLSKGLSGGYLPIAAVMTTDDIYQAFYDDYGKGTTFLHSHTYAGNPLACSAAVATLELLLDSATQDRIKRLAQLLDEAAERFEGHPHVGEVRRTGTIMAVEMARNGSTREPYPASERRGRKVYEYGLEHGVLLRPLGDVIYFMPPYVITPDQVEMMVDVAHGGLQVATAD